MANLSRRKNVYLEAEKDLESILGQPIRNDDIANWEDAIRTETGLRPRDANWQGQGFKTMCRPVQFDYYDNTETFAIDTLHCASGIRFYSTYEYVWYGGLFVISAIKRMRC